MGEWTGETKADRRELQTVRAAIALAIARVSQDGKADPVQMAADLVSSSCSDAGGNQGAVGLEIRFQHSEVGQAALPVQGEVDRNF